MNFPSLVDVISECFHICVSLEIATEVKQLLGPMRKGYKRNGGRMYWYEGLKYKG